MPYLLSFMATGDPNGEVEGIRDVQRQSEERFGPGDYRPIIPVTYWSFRYMIGFGVVTAALSLLGLFMMRGGRNPAEKKWQCASTIMVADRRRRLVPPSLLEPEASLGRHEIGHGERGNRRGNRNRFTHDGKSPASSRPAGA